MSRISRVCLILLTFTLIFISCMTVVADSNSKSIGDGAFLSGTASSIMIDVASVSLDFAVVNDDTEDDGLPGNGPIFNPGKGPLDNPGDGPLGNPGIGPLDNLGIGPVRLSVVFCPNSCA